MKLKKVKSFVINTKPPNLGGFVWYFLKLETDEGIEGWGETAVLYTLHELEESYEKLNDSRNREVDMVVFGCPHLTLNEVGELAFLLEGKKVSENVVLIIGLSRTSYALAQDCGYTQTIESAGGTFVNSCVGPMNPYIFLDDGAKVSAATNSVRAGHYLQRLSGGNTKTYYGEMNKCVQAAIKGKWED